MVEFTLIVIALLLLSFLGSILLPLRDERGGFEIYEDAAGEFRWRFRARNYAIIAESGEGYKRKDACLKAIKRFRFRLFFGFNIKDLTE